MKTNKYFMRVAMEEARKSSANGEVPVGAVVVFENMVLSKAHNETVQRDDPTAHAEIMAIRKACETKKNYRIPGCDLYVTLEPCAMCLGTVIQARIRKLVFGAYDPKSGAVESIMKFPFDKMNHRVEIKGGVLAEECGNILKDFFKGKR